MRDIELLARSRGITRLCHFAPLLNVHHILASGAILCSERIETELLSSFNPTDRLRLDGRTTHICASLEYPNVWYLEKLEALADNYPHHAIFLINVRVLSAEGVLFSARNAAGGARIHLPGRVGFDRLYEHTVTGNQTWTRMAGHPSWLPTDMQAEVLVPGSISLDSVTGVVVKSTEVAATFLAQLRAAKASLGVPLLVSAAMFDRYQVGRLRAGAMRPREEVYGA